jgi:hypothetical protein
MDGLEQPPIACLPQVEELELDSSVVTLGRRASIVSRVLGTPNSGTSCTSWPSVSVEKRYLRC